MSAPTYISQVNLQPCIICAWYLENINSVRKTISQSKYSKNWKWLDFVEKNVMMAPKVLKYVVTELTFCFDILVFFPKIQSQNLFCLQIFVIFSVFCLVLNWVQRWKCTSLSWHKIYCFQQWCGSWSNGSGLFYLGNCQFKFLENNIFNKLF